MIHQILLGHQWGLTPVSEDDGQGNIVPGFRLNLQCPHSGQVTSIPFTGDAIPSLVEQIVSNYLTEEQKSALQPLFQKGIIVPDGRLPDLRGKDVRRGNQG